MYMKMVSWILSNNKGGVSYVPDSAETVDYEAFFAETVEYEAVFAETDHSETQLG